MWRTVTVLAVAALLFSGCAGRLEELKRENKIFKSELSVERVENKRISDELAKSRGRVFTLTKEKEAKDLTILSLRTKMRVFLKGQFDSLNAFSKIEDLFDYFGGELIDRAGLDGSGQTVVDLRPLPSDAVLYMVKGKFAPGTTLVPKLFRKTKRGTICVWQGKEFTVAGEGTMQEDFDMPLNVLKGDYIGFYFPKAVGVPFDEKAGQFSVYSGDIELGVKLPGKGKAKAWGRNYSIGVSGVFQ